ncbi:MAG: tryptophan synthase subunit beta [Pseudomonas sp.]|jgi:hypothetical protein|nr:tryptophan synthase subunit beta [Pseudomonas sp.]
MVYGNDDAGDPLRLGVKVSGDCSAGSGEGAARRLEDSLLRLQQTDLEMIRVLEDLIHLLIHKRMVRITDLPEAAQAKLSERSRTRDALGGLTGLINDEEQGLI